MQTKTLTAKWCGRVRITFSRLSQTKKLQLQCKKSRTGSIRGARLSNTQHVGDKERAVLLKPNKQGCLLGIPLPAASTHRTAVAAETNAIQREAPTERGGLGDVG